VSLMSALSVLADETSAETHNRLVSYQRSKVSPTTHEHWGASLIQIAQQLAQRDWIFPSDHQFRCRAWYRCRHRLRYGGCTSPVVSRPYGFLVGLYCLVNRPILHRSATPTRSTTSCRNEDVASWSSVSLI
jgi:hypothetical protein